MRKAGNQEQPEEAMPRSGSGLVLAKLIRPAKVFEFLVLRHS